MKLNLNKKLLGLNGVEMSDKLSDVLANILANSSTEHPETLVNWAKELKDKGEIEVEKENIRALISIVENDRTFINLAKAQILSVLRNSLVS